MPHFVDAQWSEEYGLRQQVQANLATNSIAETTLITHQVPTHPNVGPYEYMYRIMVYARVTTAGAGTPAQKITYKVTYTPAGKTTPVTTNIISAVTFQTANTVVSGKIIIQPAPGSTISVKRVGSDISTTACKFMSDITLEGV
jgi:hypothetical protein